MLSIFRNVKVGQKFCFAWLNDERPEFWYTKVSNSEYQIGNETYSINDLEDDYYTQVTIDSNA